VPEKKKKGEGPIADQGMVSEARYRFDEPCPYYKEDAEKSQHKEREAQ